MSKYTEEEWKELHSLFAWSEFYRNQDWAFGWKHKERSPEGKIPDDYYLSDFKIENKNLLAVQEQIDTFEK